MGRFRHGENDQPMKTATLLLVMYDGRAVIPLEQVRKDFFWHLIIELFTRKLASGDIALPVVRMEDSQKAGKGVHVADLAAYIEVRRAAAKEHLRQLDGP